MSPEDPPRAAPFTLDRRRLLGAAGAAALAGLAGPLRGLAHGAQGVDIDPWYLADTTGNGSVGSEDLRVIRRALGTRRGTGLTPLEGYDARADILGRGFIDELDLDSVTRLLSRGPELAALPPRPVTLAWHYAWYNAPHRHPSRHTAWYKGGSYSSRSPEVETTFNALKHDFGVSVDVLAWADPRINRKLQSNLERGYLQAENAHLRRCALLYETYLSMRVRPGMRVNFLNPARRARMVKQFRLMGRFLARARDTTPVTPFNIDGRPVVFLFGSHSWGLNTDGVGAQYDWIDATIETARNSFREAYGVEPYLVGEEIPLVPEDEFDGGRARRSFNFDGIYSYHHMADPMLIEAGGGRLKGRYVRTLKALLEKAYEAASRVECRFTGKQLFVIPSLGAGFAKEGSPTLRADRLEYLDFLREMIDHHQTRYMDLHYRLVDGKPSPMVLSLGSWNEEFEGHAIFPADFNHAMSPMQRHGFDWLQSIKSTFGWNQYAAREPAVDLIPEVDLGDTESNF